MPMKIGTEMPSLEGATEWFNATGARAAEEARNHPTLVHFWSIGCQLCKEHLPRVAEWRETKREAGLRVIAVHTPRGEAEWDVEIVRENLATYNINEPCAVDNEHKLRDAFQSEQRSVPAYYLFDAEGKLRSFAAGERGLDVISPVLDQLLAAQSVPAQKLSA